MKREKTVMEKHPEIDTPRIAELAVKAQCDPSTLRKALNGKPTRGGHLRRRIEAALREAKLLE